METAITLVQTIARKYEQVQANDQRVASTCKHFEDVLQLLQRLTEPGQPVEERWLEDFQAHGLEFLDFLQDYQTKDKAWRATHSGQVEDALDVFDRDLEHFKATVQLAVAARGHNAADPDSSVPSMTSQLPPQLQSVFDVEAVVIALVQALTQCSDPAQRGLAAREIVDATAEDESLGNRLSDAGVIPPLIEMIKSRRSDHTASAAAALELLIQRPEDRFRLTEAGGIRALVDVLRDENTGGQVGAIVLLRKLAEVGTQMTRQLVTAGAIAALVRFANTTRERAREHVTKTLETLCAMMCVREGVDSMDKCSGIGLLEQMCTDPSEQTRMYAVRTLIEMARNGDSEIVAKSCRSMGGLTYRSDDIKRTIASCGGIEVMVAVMQEGLPEGTKQAAAVLWNLANLDELKPGIGALGAIPPLIDLARDGDPESVVGACGALFNLTCSCEDNKHQVATSGGIEVLVTVLQLGPPEARKSVALMLQNLAYLDELKSRISVLGAIPPLIDLARDGDSESVVEACGALDNLTCRFEDSKRELASCGGLEVLVAVLQQGLPESKKRAAMVLRNLASLDEFKPRIGALGAIPPLIDLAREGEPDSVVKACTTLYNLTLRCEDNRHKLASWGGIEVLIAVLREGLSETKTWMADPLGCLARTLDLLALPEDSSCQIHTCTAIPPTVDLVGNSDANTSAMVWACRLLVNVTCYYNDNIHIVASCGGIEILADVLHNGAIEAKRSAVWTLENLSVETEYVRRMGAQDLVAPLVEIWRHETGQTKENAAVILRKLAAQHFDAVRIHDALGDDY